MELAADSGDEYGLFGLDLAFHHSVYEAANLPAMLPILDRCTHCGHCFRITQTCARRTLHETAERLWSVIDAIKTVDAGELERVLFHRVASLMGEVTAQTRLEGLPPIFLNAAGLDCLRDASVLLALRLPEAGVPHVFSVAEGVTCGFMQMGRDLPKDAAAFQTTAQFIATVLPPYRSRRRTCHPCAVNHSICKGIPYPSHSGPCSAPPAVPLHGPAAAQRPPARAAGRHTGRNLRQTGSVDRAGTRSLPFVQRTARVRHLVLLPAAPKLENLWRTTYSEWECKYTAS